MEEHVRTLTAEMIVDLTLPSQPAISPDGRLVAYVLERMAHAGEHDRAAIWMAPLDGSAEPRQFTTGTASDQRPRWSPDGGRLAFLSDRARPGTARLYLIHRDGGEAVPLAGGEGEGEAAVAAFEWSPDGGSIAYLSPDEPTDEDRRREKERDDPFVWGERRRLARLRLIDIASGAVRTLYATDRHVRELAWSPDGGSIAIATASGEDLEAAEEGAAVEVVGVDGGPARPVCTVPCRLGGFGWSADGSRILFVASFGLRPQSSDQLWAVPAGGGEPVRLAPGEDACAEGFALPRGERRALLGVAAGLESRAAWVDVAGGGVEPLPLEWGMAPAAAVVGSGRVAVAGMARREDVATEIWAGSAPRGETVPLTRISFHQRAFDGVRFGVQREFRWTAPDGLELDGVLTLPPGAPGGPLPAVLLVHGGPYARVVPGLAIHAVGNWTQWLATDGIAVLQPNPRGGMGHGEAFAAAVRADVGGADWGDVGAAADALVERGIADPNRLGIGGWSQGGFMTAWAVTQTDRFKVGVMGAGISDWGMMAMTNDMPRFEAELGGSVPWDGPGPHRHAELSPISFAGRVRTPLLILHGQRDERVPVSQATAFHRALRRNGSVVELVTYPREGHSLRERNHQLDALRRVREWYRRWLFHQR